jgi:hypothetical protein
LSGRFEAKPQRPAHTQSKSYESCFGGSFATTVIDDMATSVGPLTDHRRFVSGRVATVSYLRKLQVLMSLSMLRPRSPHSPILHPTPSSHPQHTWCPCLDSSSSLTSKEKKKKKNSFQSVVVSGTTFFQIRDAAACPRRKREATDYQSAMARTSVRSKTDTLQPDPDAARFSHPFKPSN